MENTTIIEFLNPRTKEMMTRRYTLNDNEDMLMFVLQSLVLEFGEIVVFKVIQ